MSTATPRGTLPPAVACTTSRSASLISTRPPSGTRTRSAGVACAGSATRSVSEARARATAGRRVTLEFIEPASSEPSPIAHAELARHARMQGIAHVALHVDDCHEAMAEFERRGVVVVPTHDTPEAGMRCGFVHDLNGVLLELVEPLRSYSRRGIAGGRATCDPSSMESSPAWTSPVLVVRHAARARSHDLATAVPGPGHRQLAVVRSF